MTARYPREQVDAVLRAVHTGTVHRIVLRMGLNNPLALRAGKSRFCDGCSYAVLYAASTLETAFVETVVRDRFVQTDRRVILLDEVRSRGCVEYTLGGTESLHLVDLREDGCLRLGAPTDSAHARNHLAGRALSRALHDGHDHVDGIWYRSRLTGGECFAIFERSVTKLTPVQTQDLIGHPDLPALLREHRIALER